MAEKSGVSHGGRRLFAFWFVSGLVFVVTSVGFALYRMAMPERDSPPFPASITMPEGVAFLSVETSGSPSCLYGECETTTYNYSSPSSVRSLCSDVISAVEQWSETVLAPVEGGSCGETGLAQGWRIFVGVSHPTGVPPQASQIVVAATKM